MGSEGEYESSEQSSPKNKVKFLCSHGGKILPRPTDGKLKYVGGETRVVAVCRDISFSELMKKLSTLFDGEMVLKYQIVPEDLDALVSVRSDEDLKHMMDEYDRHESEGTLKLRAFLFPPKPVILENQVGPMDPQLIEQRYIDAINGVVRAAVHSRLRPINAIYPSLSISSTGSSPKSNSPDAGNVDLAPIEPAVISGTYHGSRLSMHRVHSSPTLCSLNVLPPHTSSIVTSPHIHNQQHNNHNYYQNQHPNYNYHPPPYPSPPRVPQDFLKSVVTERLSTSGRGELVRVPTTIGVNQYYSLSRNNSGSGSSSRCGCCDDSAAYNGCGWIDRADSVPQSPRKTMW